MDTRGDVTEQLEHNVGWVALHLSLGPSSIWHRSDHDILDILMAKPCPGPVLSKTKTTHQLEITQKLDEQLALLTLITSELDKEYSTVIDSILLAKVKVLHPSVINPTQFITELTKTINRLPSGSEYPTPMELTNAHTLFDLSEIINRIRNKKNAHDHNNTCNSLTNCITLTMCKNQKDRLSPNVSIELSSVSDS
ncbi:hypothetical protein FQA39_LY05787 [Lamprigera yunnana]|nr:hypothetical protein FQA39_LY05787 [Lamprigera yunnana]